MIVGTLKLSFLDVFHTKSKQRTFQLKHTTYQSTKRNIYLHIQLYIHYSTQQIEYTFFQQYMELSLK